MEHISTVLCCGELRTIKLTLIRHEGLIFKASGGHWYCRSKGTTAVAIGRRHGLTNHSLK